MRKIFGTLLFGAVLMTPSISLAAGQNHDDHAVDNAHRIYDRDHKDWHNWDAREDRAYRMWGTDQHRDYVEWKTLPARDQAAYWTWRHNHSDAVLKIDAK